MKWRSINLWYAVALIPPMSLLAALGVLLANRAVWALVAFPATAIALSVMVVCKTRHLPRPSREYSGLEFVDLGLPREYGVRTAACGALDRYPFLNRVAEFLSPLRFKGEAPIVVFSPRLMETQGKTFISIAVCREIEQYRRKVQLKNILQLTVPVLLGGAAVAAFMLWAPVSPSPFFRQFVMPLAITALLAGHFMLWNKSLSLREQELDRVLIGLFPVDAVESYIRVTEEMERGNEKEKYRPFSEHYAAQRIRKLQQDSQKNC